MSWHESHFRGRHGGRSVNWPESHSRGIRRGRDRRELLLSWFGLSIVSRHINIIIRDEIILFNVYLFVVVLVRAGGFDCCGYPCFPLAHSPLPGIPSIYSYPIYNFHVAGLAGHQRPRS